MDEETEKVFLQAMMLFESRLTSIEVAQQIIALFLRGTSPERSIAMAAGLRNLAKSGHKQIDKGAANYLENLALWLEDDPNAQLLHLLKDQGPSPVTPDDLRKVLRVIEGGKSET